MTNKTHELSVKLDNHNLVLVVGQTTEIVCGSIPIAHLEAGSWKLPWGEPGTQLINAAIHEANLILAGDKPNAILLLGVAPTVTVTEQEKIYSASTFGGVYEAVIHEVNERFFPEFRVGGQRTFGPTANLNEYDKAVGWIKQQVRGVNNSHIHMMAWADNE